MRLWGQNGTFSGLRDILRHEYGHGFAFEYPALVRRNKEFTELFGARHDSGIAFEFDPEFHLTPYAATNPCEDFAECFMAVLKYKGQLNRFKHRSPLYRKMRWIISLAQQI